MPPAKKTLVVGIAGGTGSGKTTVAQNLMNRIGAEHFAFLPQDAYYRDLGHLSFEQRAALNFDHPDALENDLLAEHILQLRAGHEIRLPVYDFSTHSRTAQWIPVQPRRVILVEGILIFAEPRLRQLCDVKIFVDADADIRFIRRLERDLHDRGRSTQSVVQQYLQTVRPMHLEFVEPSKRYADLIIPEGGHNAVAMDLLTAHISSLLKGRRRRKV